MASKRKGPPWSFEFLGIPYGDEIEFWHKDEGIFLDGPEEKFTVAKQDGPWIRNREVTWEYDGWATTHKLKSLTDELVLKRNPKTSLSFWVLRFWRHCKTQKRLDCIYKEKCCAQKTNK